MEYIWKLIQNNVWVFVAVSVLLYVLYSHKDYFRCVRFVMTLDGPPAMPLLGNIDLISSKTFMQHVSQTFYQNYGPVIRLWWAIFPAVMLIEPADTQIVLSNSKHLKKPFFYHTVQNFIGGGLSTSEGDRWRTHRSILQSAFHLSFLDRFIDSFSKCADYLVQDLLDAGESNVNLTRIVNDTANDILNETVIGMTLSSKQDRLTAKEELPFRKGQGGILYRYLRPWLLVDWIYDRSAIGKRENSHRALLLKTCKRLIADKREAFRKRRSENSGVDEPYQETSLLEYMVGISERDPSFTEQDIIDECCTFMLAGQDTIGSSVATTIFLLAAHRDWQQRCVEELNDIFESDSRLPIMKDLRKMRCLEMCIKESLRLYPSVPLFAMKLEEDTKIGKHVIPSGCDINIVPYACHRSADHFPDPETFDPTRFEPETVEKRHPYAFIPFSAGVRSCIGQKFAMLEIKALVSTVLRNFHLSPVPGKEEIRSTYRLTLRAQGGLWVNLKPKSDRNV